MAAKLLDDRHLHALHAATIDAGLAEQRLALAQGIDASFFASLPVSPSPSVQLLTDLHGLNLTLGDGSVPIGRWLKNAFVLAGSRPAAAVFARALDELCLPLPARPLALAPPLDPASRGALADRTDVVILAAAQDELLAVLALDDEGQGRWEERRDLQGFPYFRRAFAREASAPLVIAAAWIGALGQDVDTALRGQQLVAELQPACLAMCGACGGARTKVALGDLIVADQLYLYDHGELLAGDGPESGSFHPIEGYGPGRVWKMDAAFFARTFALDALTQERPRSLAGQRAWLLRALHAHQNEGAEAPDKHPDRKALCPAWKHLVPALRDEGLLAIADAQLRLTARGQAVVDEDRLINLDGLPSEPALRVHVGAMAAGPTVRRDPTLFDRLARIERATIAVDLEGAAVAQVAAWFGKRSLVVKAVADHADDDRDDRYRAFACKASATFLLAFLRRHQSVEPHVSARPAPPASAAIARDEPRGAGFVDRVEQICRLRSPSALFLHHATPHPFAGALEMIVPRTPVTHRELLVTLEHTVNEDALATLAREILPARRRDGSLGCKLIHLAPTAPADLALRAQRLDVELVTFDAYQGLVDFSRYSAWLARRLANDPEYPRWLYVEQPASVSLAGQPAEPTPSALTSLRELVDKPERRFALILGDFGAGKSFLLRELARTLLDGDGSRIPVLVEMRYLEKTLSLRTLLAQHFGAADAGSVDIDAFLYMLREGRVVLLFDGFDELAVRVTYDQVLQHFATITGAVEGKAKVIISSRRQHFLDDGQVKLELARSAEQLQGYRLVELHRFEERQIRRFLRNRLKDAAEADARYQLIHDVKDLLGLSHNPRMLSFIADLERERLEAAREAAGEITPAKLYEVLIDRWLDGECARTQVKKESLLSAVRSFARKLWATPGNAVDLGSLPRDLVPRLEGLKQTLSEEEARLVIGSRSLLKRDAEGMFSFVHRSVLEWLVAGEAVREIAETGTAVILAAEAMSPLMARFFVNLAGRDKAEAWARREFEAGKGAVAEKNALSVAGELKLQLTVNLEGRDLRGFNLSGLNLRGANLRGVNLEGVALGSRDLTGADLTGARLVHVDLRGGMLTDVNLTGADLTFTRLTGADLTGAKLTETRLLGANLLNVQGLTKEDHARAEREDAAVTGVVSWGIASLASDCWTVAYHPAGHLLATGHYDSTVRLWDTATGQILRVLERHTSGVRDMVFSPDGLSIAFCSDDGMIRVLDVMTGQTLRVLEGHTAGVRSVAFNPNGLDIASGSEDQTVRVWDASSGQLLRVLEGHTGGVRSVAFSPDGLQIISGSQDRTVKLWDASSGQGLSVLEGHLAGVRSVAFSPDGRQIASASEDKTVRLWDAGSGHALQTLTGHTKWVRSVAFSPDGTSLASGSEDKTVRLWDAASGGLLRVLSGHINDVLSVAFSPDGMSLASGSEDKTIKLWDAVSGHTLHTLMRHATWVKSVVFSPDGRSLACASEDKTIRIWDASSCQLLHTIKSSIGWVRSVAFSPDGQSLASGSWDGTAGLWDAVSGRLLRALSGHSGRVWSMVFSSDGRSLASGSEDGTVRIWDAASGALLRLIEGHTRRVWDVAFSPDGQSLASCSDDGTVLLWNEASSRFLRELSGHTGSVWSVAFSPDGRSLASGSEDKKVRLWDAESGHLLRTLVGHTGPVRSVVYSSSGRWLASASEDRTIRIWDAASKDLVRVLSGHTASVTSVAFSPDSQSLASSSTDGTIRLWDVASGRCLAALLSTPEGWVAFVPEAHPGGPPRGAFKLGGDIAGSFWHRIGLARFEPGELDELLPEGQKLRLPDDYAFLPPR